MNVSIWILGLTLLAAFIFVLVIVLLYLLYWKPPPTPEPPGGSWCVEPGTLPSIPIPTYTRTTEKISPPIPEASDNKSQIPVITNTTPPNVRTRALTSNIPNSNYPIPTNKWYTPILVGESTGWLAQYPYLIRVNGESLGMSWTSTSAPDSLNRVWNQVHPITISPGIEDVQATDILNWDSEGCILQYSLLNQTNGETGSLLYPLIRGAPYISISATNASISLVLNETAVLSGPFPIGTWYRWTITYTDSTSYQIYLSRFISPILNGNIITIPPFTGWCRIAYSVDLSLLNQYANLVPQTTTVTSTATGYRLTYSTADNETGTLMTVLDPAGSHIGMLPYNYQVGPVSVTLDLSVPDFTPSTTPDLVGILAVEIPLISGLVPTTFSDWCRWVGSLAMLANISDAAGQTGSVHVNLLNLIQDKLTNPPDTLYMDLGIETKSWGGLIPNIDMATCTAVAGRYTNTLHDYGYLIFAWETLIRLVPGVDTDIAPGPADLVDHVMATLVREKDWWIGWDQTGGLVSNNEVVWPQSSEFAYWATYRLTQVMQLETDLQEWCLRAYGSTKWFLNTWCYAATWNPLMSASRFTNSGYGLARSGGDMTFPNRYAALMVSLTKPLAPTIGPSQISAAWLAAVTTYVPLDGTLTPESLLTSLYLHQTAITVEDVVQLPYGSTWSSGAYLLSL